MLKTRSLSVTIPAWHKLGYWVGNSTPAFGVGPQPAVTFPSSTEEITTYNSGGATSNPCLHWKWELKRLPANARVRDIRPEYSNLDWDIPDGCLHFYAHGQMQGNGLYNALASWLASGYVYQKINWNDLSARAWDAMAPSLSQGFSSLNFAYELREAKQLFELWNKKKRRLYNIASGHLNYSFGWSPFVSDLHKIHRILQQIADKIREFEERAGKLQKRHFKCFIPMDLPPSYTGPLGTYGEQYQADYTWKTAPTYTATAVYRYSIPDMPSGVKKTCLQWLNAFGVGLDPEILWEAVPYSFVVDWFFGVGDFLHRIRKDLYPATITLLEFTHSVKLEALGTHRARQDSLPLTDVWSTSYKLYDRRRGIPSTLSIASNSIPGVDKLALAGSLLVTRSRKR